MRPILRRREPRLWLVDAARGFIHPALAYARSQTVYARQLGGAIIGMASGTPLRAYDDTLGWHYRVNPTYQQLALRTAGLSNAAWTRTALQATTQDSAGPSGFTDGWSFVESTGNSAHKQEQSISFTSGTTYDIHAIVAPRAGSRLLTLVLPAAAFGSDAICTVNPSDGTFTKNATALSVVAEQLSNGYWFFHVFATATATASGTVTYALHRTATATVDSYTGDGTSGCNVWALGVFDTAWPAPYVAAAGSTVSVGGSTWAAALSSLGLSLAGDYTMGVEYFSHPYPITPPARIAMQVDSNSAAERSVIRYNGATAAVRAVSVSASVSSTVDSFTVNEGLRVKQTMRVGIGGQHKSACNGSIGAGIGATAPAGMTNVRIGNDTGNNQLAGGIFRAWLIGAGIGDGALTGYTR